MFRQLKTFTVNMLAGANVVTIIVMLLVGYSCRLDPVAHPVFANFGLAFPALLVVNLGFLVFFLIFRRRMLLIPVAGLVVGYVPVRTYSPLNITHAAPDSALKVMSYNVYSFKNASSYGNIDLDTFDIHAYAQYVKGVGPHIVCMQEAFYNDAVRDSFLSDYPYQDSLRNRRNNDMLLTFSKYPIVDKEHINADLDGCVCGAFRIDVGGDTITVINCHLETSGLSLEQRDDFHRIIKGKWGDEDSVSVESRRILVRLADAAKRRAPQVKGIVSYIQSHPDDAILLCGDFNDSPISYAHHALSNVLTDCYIATGNGPGVSYRKNAIYVRIDNVMCSSQWEPYEFCVDRSVSVSDHYPIWGYVNKKPLMGKKSR